MIVSVRAKNFYIFSEEIEFSLTADMRSKRLNDNIHSEYNFNVVKSAGIFGTNNSGKTSLIKCISVIKNVLLNNPVNIMPNLFTKKFIVELGIKFLNNSKMYDYSFKYDIAKNEYVYEKLSEIIKTQSSYYKENVILLIDVENKKYSSEDKNLTKYLSIISRDNISIYLLNSKISKSVTVAKEILTNLAKKIEIVDMNNIPIQKTIYVMKNGHKYKNEVVNFIKNADLNLEDFKYENSDNIHLKANIDSERPAENALDMEAITDQFKLISVYNGVHIPSIIFDSTGTKKIASLASYIVEALHEGKILVIDELDSSLHFSLTRSIVAMFNNTLNKNSQLIFTAHDISLLDCQKLMRKEQIWFMHKNSENSYLYSLAEFKASDGVRETSDIIEKYKKGLLGAIPEPNFINSLIDIAGGILY